MNINTVKLVALQEMKHLDRTGIPHYLLFDQRGNLVERNAPRPDSKEIRDKIDALLEVM